MNVMSLDVQSDGNLRGHWRLHVIGDLHLDGIATDRARIEDHIEFVADDPHSIYIVVGDLIDGSTPGHRFFDTSVIRPDVLMQMGRYVDYMTEELVELFKPLEGRSGVFLRGNHDIRKGIDYSGIVQSVARKVGAAYAGDECLLRIRAKEPNRDRNQIWKIYAHHGNGGGSFPGSKVNRFQHTVGVLAEADMYVRGHVHDSDCRIIHKISVTSKGEPHLTTHPRAFLTAPGYTPDRTDGVDGYAGQKGLPPLDHGIIFLHCQNEYQGGKREAYIPKKIYREEWRG